MMNDDTVPHFIKLVHPENGEVCIYPGRFEQKHLNSAAKYVAEAKDIFICSYPKCGSTWLQNIVWLITHKGNTLPANLRECVAMLEFDGAEKTLAAGSADQLRIVKTHFKESWVPKHPDAKYLYITRNPKDALVSYYYHVKGFEVGYHCRNADFQKLFKIYVEGEVGFGSYFDHVTDWYRRRNDSNVLFLLYEDLKRNTRSEVLKIAKFLGESYLKEMLRDDEAILKLVLEKSSFEKMSQDSAAFNNAPRLDDQPFVRKGVIGDWKTHLTKEQSATINEMIREKGKAAGWSNLWDNHADVFD